MDAPSHRRRVERRTLGIMGLVVFFIIILFYNLKKPVYRLLGDFFSPYLTVSAQSQSWVGSSLAQFKSKKELIIENNLLKKENEQLQPLKHESIQLKQENETLRKLLYLSSPEKYKYITAQLILRDPASWDSSFMIDVGGNKGVVAGTPVLAIVKRESATGWQNELALVGRVSEISDRTAQVFTLINPKCNISVFLPRSKSAAILKGGLSDGDQSRGILQYLPKEIRLKEGDLVYSSGFSDLTPQGILVGSIGLQEDGLTETVIDGLYASAEVCLAIDLSMIQFVIIPVKESF